MDGRKRWRREQPVSVGDGEQGFPGAGGDRYRRGRDRGRGRPPGIKTPPGTKRPSYPPDTSLNTQDKIEHHARRGHGSEIQTDKVKF